MNIVQRILLVLGLGLIGASVGAIFSGGYLLAASLGFSGAIAGFLLMLTGLAPVNPRVPW